VPLAPVGTTAGRLESQFTPTGAPVSRSRPVHDRAGPAGV